MAARKKRNRTPGRKNEKPTVLVVCEGETEHEYFNWIRRQFRANWILPKLSDQTDPKGVLSCAKHHQKKLRRKGLQVETWIVFDAESKAEEAARGYRDVITSADARGVRAANSSPCFEYWILIHFEPGIMVIEPRQAKKELGKAGRVPGYKEPALPYEELWSILRTGTPSEAAKKKRSHHEEMGEDPRFARPVTYVDVLVDRLLEIYDDTYWCL